MGQGTEGEESGYTRGRDGYTGTKYTRGGEGIPEGSAYQRGWVNQRGGGRYIRGRARITEGRGYASRGHIRASLC